jgi:hypothetical protein
MLIRFWRATHDEDGQAIVVAAIGLLVVAFTVLATATLGNAIHEKVRLQNAADGAAYSVAAVQARAFNFYAFTNRTMASHYVAVMVLQSYLAVATFVYSAIETARVVVGALRSICRSWCGRPFCAAIDAFAGGLMSILLAALDVIDGILATISAIIWNFLWGVPPLDFIIGWMAVPFFVLANWLLYLAQASMMLATTAAVIDGGGQSVEMAYADTGTTPVPGLAGVPAGALNMTHWNRAHDPDAMNVTPLQPGKMMRLEDRMARVMDRDVDVGIRQAQRIMTEISNATRWNRFVFNRSLDGTSFGTVLSMVSDATLGLFSFDLFGETKMITESWPNHNLRQNTSYDNHDLRPRNQHGGHTYMPQGGSVVADQWLEIDFLVGSYNMTHHRLRIAGLITRDFAAGQRHSAVAASHRNFSPVNRWGWHCVTHTRQQRICLVRAIVCTCRARMRTINANRSRCDAPEPTDPFGGNHPWWGVTPFMKFNPLADGAPGVDFHQPSTFSWWHQPPENIDRAPLLQRAVLTLAGHEGVIDTSVEAEGEMAGLIGPGFHAVSRGMVYYHRPGNWAEHPNFFNPFWRAKLEPIAPVLDEVAQFVPGADVFANPIMRRMVTH